MILDTLPKLTSQKNCMMQLTTEQRVFVVTEWIRTGCLQEVADRFGERFPERPVPAKSTFGRMLGNTKEKVPV